MRSRAGTSSMNTIDLFREIRQKDLQECRGVCPEREGESPGLNGHRERNRIAKPDKVPDPTTIRMDYYDVFLQKTHFENSLIIF
jgi:hypothetical protein